MRSTVFKLDTASDEGTPCECDPPEHVTYKYTVPTLGAYAVEHAQLSIDGGHFYVMDGASISVDEVTIHTNPGAKLHEKTADIIVYFHGIRDYELLFPAVTPPELKTRLGMFYRECEAAFDNGIWLTFMLMCGAIFEGILYSKLGVNETFNTLINNAVAGNVIDDDAAAIMHRVRGYRNLVHANRHTEPYVTRAEAMDTRALLDKTIKQA